MRNVKKTLWNHCWKNVFYCNELYRNLTKHLCVYIRTFCALYLKHRCMKNCFHFTCMFLSMIQFMSKSSSSSPNGLIICSATCRKLKTQISFCVQHLLFGSQQIMEIVCKYLVMLSQFQLILSKWSHMMTQIWVSIGSGNWCIAWWRNDITRPNVD